MLQPDYQKAPINMLSRDETQQFEGFTHPRKPNVFLFATNPDGTFCARKNFAYLDSFAKVTVSA